MKLRLTLIFTISMMLLHGSTSIWANISVQQPTNERRFQEGFKDNYSGRNYNYDGKAAVRSTSTKHGDASKYSQDKPFVGEDNNANEFSFDFSAFNWFFILILILAVGYLAYTLLNDGSSKLFSTRQNEKLQSHSEITADNITQTDIKTLIKKAEQTEDYRLAIRYYYLLVLKQLTLKNFIKYEDDKTNAEYMNAIASRNFSKDFAYTSYIYDYTWYGEFALDKRQYDLAKNSFVQLIKAVNS
ncbi:hypothetical protein [Gelidibacter maritimus]|uniref:DUF4129 domain-containing protein n=1 Tax=Gelidibacter maritimus TaxID=2761487 RepID=A0A7W2R4X2_9FLAO|nr:hypothetical protein [Gelidibacter maritimus]MBA6154346.1 hypothetical protein [Gelidibacter maritimus]